MSKLAPTHPVADQARGYVVALLLVSVATLVGLAIAPRWGTSSVDLLYLPAVLAVAAFAGLGPALFAAVGSMLCYNFFFTAPHLTFRISNPNDVLTVVVLFFAALVTSQLAASIRSQARRATAHADRNATIAGLARRLLACTDENDVAVVATTEVAGIFDCNAMLIDPARDFQSMASAPGRNQLGPNDMAAAMLASTTGSPTGRGVHRSVPTEWQFHPVRSGPATLAVLALARDDGMPAVPADHSALLDNLIDQLALALERSRLEEEARNANRVRERDRVRTRLLSTIVQDLRPSLDALGHAARELRRSGEGDRSIVAEIGSETAKVERYLKHLAEVDSDGADEPLRCADVVIDLFHREVTRDGTLVHLTPKEYAVLAELAKHPGRVLGHGHLLRVAWGPAQEDQADYLRVVIRSLRKKLERDPSAPTLILNEPAVGYRLNDGRNAAAQAAS